MGKLTLSVGGLRGGGGGGGWMMTSRSKGSTSPSMPLSVSSGSSSSSRASSFLKGSRSLYVSKLSCLTRGWQGERGQVVNCTGRTGRQSHDLQTHTKEQLQLRNDPNQTHTLYLKACHKQIQAVHCLNPLTSKVCD